MPLYHGFDCAFPPPKPKPWTLWAGLYIGGNTPHVATAAEWNAQTGRRYCPIWTGDNEDDPRIHATEAANKAQSLGWTAHHVPWKLIALDMEGEVDPDWINEFVAELQIFGFDTVPYFSVSAMQGGDPTRYKWWLPDWDGLDTLPQLPYVVCHQYRGQVPFADTTVDMDTADSWFWDRLGVGPRH